MSSAYSDLKDSEQNVVYLQFLPKKRNCKSSKKVI